MSKPDWNIQSSEGALEFISEEYNRLEVFKPDLGERFFEAIEKCFQRLKENPFQFPKKNEIYRKALIPITKKIEYIAYFRMSENDILVDLILSTSSNPDIHPA